MDINQIRFTPKVVEEIEQNIGEFEDRGFHLLNGVLHWREKLVVPTTDVNSVMTELYTGIGANIGRDRLYRRVRDQYVGISRRRVMRFLKAQETYQLHQPIPTKRTVRPIITKRVRQRWQMDLIDMRSLSGLNNNDNWIMTVIDLFSKRAWAFPVKRKDSNGIAKLLFELFTQEKPTLMQSDRGPEFVNAYVAGVMRRFGVKHILSKAYTPQSQGAVERFNGTLKRMIYSHFTMYNTKKWNDVVGKLVDEYNQTVHSVTKQKPIDLHEEKGEYDVHLARRRIRTKAEKLLKEGTRSFPEVEQGDFVRISKMHWDVLTPDGRTIQTFAVDERAAKLTGFSKSYLPNWSREIFQVRRISGGEPNPQYTLQSMKGNQIKQRFYRDHLLVLPKRQVGTDERGVPVYAPVIMKNTKPRPVYRADIFNREEHLRGMSERDVVEREEPIVAEDSLAVSRPRRQPHPTQDPDFVFFR